MDTSIEFTPTVNYAFANDDAVSVAPDNMVEYNPYPNYQADVINAAGNNSDLGDNSSSGINYLGGESPGTQEQGNQEAGYLDKLKAVFNKTGGEPDKPEKSVEQILKEYGMSDKVISSLIQTGGGMLAGASSAKMMQKNREAQWERDDQVVARERARREANNRAGTVSKLNYKPTGLLAAMKK